MINDSIWKDCWSLTRSVWCFVSSLTLNRRTDVGKQRLWFPESQPETVCRSITGVSPSEGGGGVRNSFACCDPYDESRLDPKQRQLRTPTISASRLCTFWDSLTPTRQPFSALHLAFLAALKEEEEGLVSPNLTSST